MNEKLTTLYGTIAQLNYEEAYEVQDALASRIELLEMQQRQTFSVGDRVIFDDKRGIPMKGEITKIMRKNIKVKIDESFQVWSVHPSFLTVVNP
jgi:hypothetical protein